MVDVFDKNDVFEAQILPQVKKVKEICVEKGYSFFVTFAVRNSESGTEYRSECVSVPVKKADRIPVDEPAVAELRRLCVLNRIPFFMLASKLEEGEEDPANVAEVLTPDRIGCAVADNRIVKCLNVMNGFETVLHRQVFFMDDTVM